MRFATHVGRVIDELGAQVQKEVTEMFTKYPGSRVRLQAIGGRLHARPELPADLVPPVDEPKPVPRRGKKPRFRSKRHYQT